VAARTKNSIGRCVAMVWAGRTTGVVLEAIKTCEYTHGVNAVEIPGRLDWHAVVIVQRVPTEKRSVQTSKLRMRHTSYQGYLFL
jgi:hypothetical protein